MPANLLHGHGPGKLVQETSGIGGKAGEGHTLGTHLEGEHLDGVQGLQGGDSDRVNGTKDEDHGQSSLGSCRVVVDGVTVGIDAGLRSRKARRGNGHAHPDDDTGGKREEQQGATTHTVDQKGTEDGPGKLLAVVDEGDVGLLNGSSVTGRVENRAEEVGQHGIAGPLTKDGDGDVAKETVDGRAAAEQRPVIPPALVGTVHVEELLVLEELQLDPRRVRIAVAVVLGEDSLGLLLLVVHVEPSGGFGEEHGEDADETGEEGLEPGDESPRVITADVETASGSTGRDDGTREPQGVVHG